MLGKCIVTEMYLNDPITSSEESLTVPQTDLTLATPQYIYSPQCVTDPISAVPEKQWSNFISKQSRDDLMAEAPEQECLYCSALHRLYSFTIHN